MGRYIKYGRPKFKDTSISAGKVVYGIRWLDNVVIDFLGHFQYDEAKSNKGLQDIVRKKYGRTLIVLKADEEFNIWGSTLELAHAERLWNTYMINKDPNDVWRIVK